MRLKSKHVCIVSLGFLLCLSLAGCGNNKAGSTSGNNKNDSTNSLAEDVGEATGDLADGAGNVAEDIVDGAGNAIEDAADGAGNVAEDVADGAGNTAKDIGESIGNAMDNLLGENGFDNYNDAHDYFLDTMHAYHADAKFEIRDEDRELNNYQEGSKGYRFKLYDTSKNDNGDLFGEFFVDANSGQIFKKDNSGNIKEYPIKDNATNKRSKKVNSNTDTGMSK